MKYAVKFTDSRTKATSTIGTITGPTDYTPDQYIADQLNSTDPGWIALLSPDTVRLVPVQD